MMNCGCCLRVVSVKAGSEIAGTGVEVVKAGAEIAGTGVVVVKRARSCEAEHRSCEGGGIRSAGLLLTKAYSIHFFY